MNPQTPQNDLSPRTLLLGLLLALSLFYVTLARDSYTDDFRAFYVAAMATHDGLDPYLNHVDLNEKYADGVWVRVDSRFIYPPTALLFLSPLAHVSYRVAKLGMAVLLPLVMVGVLMGLQRRFPNQTLVLLALFLSIPMFMNVDSGQLDCFILALTLAAFYLVDGAAAGLCLGIAIAVKFSPVLTLVWFLGNKRWRTAAWTAATVGVLGAVSYVRWGQGYFREFAHNMIHHHENGLPRLTHGFTTVTKVDQRFISTTDGLFAYKHELGGFAQNPFGTGPLSHFAGPLFFVAFAVWLFASKTGRRLSPEQSFFMFLVVGLLANHLLWAMGLVACYPLLLLLVDSSRSPNRAALLLLLPFFLTEPLVGGRNFLIWLPIAGFLAWQAGWFNEAEAEVSAEQLIDLAA